MLENASKLHNNHNVYILGAGFLTCRLRPVLISQSWYWDIQSDCPSMVDASEALRYKARWLNAGSNAADAFVTD